MATTVPTPALVTASHHPVSLGARGDSPQSGLGIDRFATPTLRRRVAGITSPHNHHRSPGVPTSTDAPRIPICGEYHDQTGAECVADGEKQTDPSCAATKHHVAVLFIQALSAEVSGWQRQYERYEDELDDPRSLALPDWAALTRLADALVAASWDNYQGWGDVVVFTACTATRIGEVSGCRLRDIDTDQWIWRLRRQTSPGPGGLKDKGTKGKRSRRIPIIEDIRPLVLQRIQAANRDPDARLFVGPRGGRIQTGVLHKATHWDKVVAKVGYEHLRRHGLRHTGLTWFADAGVPLHRLQQIAGHTDPRITQRYPPSGHRGAPKRRQSALATPTSATTVPKWSPTASGQLTANPLRPRSEGISACRADRI
ncbi:tyrosine-type recombinase/integrase [Nocardia sp. NPDC049526]|uniref:tyrosine-type recombinase/integrase n=1 Tax=Nocardia sp. NPDC049526 TaxID=3364316 RepID=UPI0037A7CA35